MHWMQFWTILNLMKCLIFVSSHGDSWPDPLLLRMPNRGDVLGGVSSAPMGSCPIGYDVFVADMGKHNVRRFCWFGMLSREYTTYIIRTVTFIDLKWVCSIVSLCGTLSARPKMGSMVAPMNLVGKPEVSEKSCSCMCHEFRRLRFTTCRKPTKNELVGCESHGPI